MMKQYQQILLIFTVWLLLIAFSLLTSAEDAFPTENEIAPMLSEFYASVENGDVSALYEKSNRTQSMLSLGKIFTFGFTSLKEAFGEAKGLFLPLICLVMLTAFCSVLLKDRANVYTGMEQVTLLCAVLLVLQAVQPVMRLTDGFIRTICTFLGPFTASMSLVLVSGGQTATASVTSANAAFAVSMTELFTGNVILPCMRIVLCLSVIGTLAKGFDFSGIMGFLKSFCLWALGVVFAVFGGVHAATVTMSSSADSLALRGIRFTAARLIPVAGNMLSESLRTVLSGISVLKNTLGGLGLVYVLAVTLPVICTVLAVKFSILGALFLSKLCGTKSLTAFFDGIGGSLNILIAVVLFAAVSSILILAVFMQIQSGL